MPKTIEMKYMDTDSGFCKVNFKTKVMHEDEGWHWAYYCIMEETANQVSLYRTSGGDWNEPECTVTPKEGVTVEFETPPDEYGQKLVELYKEGNNAA